MYNSINGKMFVFTVLEMGIATQMGTAIQMGIAIQIVRTS
jgi:hypothetical protein